MVGSKSPGEAEVLQFVSGPVKRFRHKKTNFSLLLFANKRRKKRGLQSEVGLTWLEPNDEGWNLYEEKFRSSGRETISVNKAFTSRQSLFNCVDDIFCLSEKRAAQNSECQKRRPADRKSNYCKASDFSDLTPISRSCDLSFQRTLQKILASKKKSHLKPGTKRQ